MLANSMLAMKLRAALAAQGRRTQAAAQLQAQPPSAVQAQLPPSPPAAHAPTLEAVGEDSIRVTWAVPRGVAKPQARNQLARRGIIALAAGRRCVRKAGRAGRSAAAARDDLLRGQEHRPAGHVRCARPPRQSVWLGSRLAFQQGAAAGRADADRSRRTDSRGGRFHKPARALYAAACSAGHAGLAIFANFRDRHLCPARWRCVAGARRFILHSERHTAKGRPAALGKPIVCCCQGAV
mmetsp:Transcript_34796/g.103717  ORF Transcript_34796/g.103717 Transcript_34796/m.103717 type:complete len:238 (+) Transcript_34796:35-748(+)